MPLIYFDGTPIPLPDEMSLNDWKDARGDNDTYFRCNFVLGLYYPHEPGVGSFKQSVAELAASLEGPYYIHEQTRGAGYGRQELLITVLNPQDHDRLSRVFMTPPWNTLEHYEMFSSAVKKNREIFLARAKDGYEYDNGDMNRLAYAAMTSSSDISTDADFENLIKKTWPKRMAQNVRAMRTFLGTLKEQYSHG